MRPEPQLLDQLVTLTTIRDAELLEYSLLRTIQDMLAPLLLSLVRCGPQGELVSYRLVDSSCGQQIVQGEPVRSEVSRMIAGLSEGTSVVREDLGEEGLLAVFPIQDARAPLYLQVLTAPGLATSDNDRLILGFLRFYANYCNLLDYSQRDQLTGLMNRKTFDESIYKLFSQASASTPSSVQANDSNERRAERQLGQFWLGMIDVDHFKRVNDTFGHLYGDEVLLLAAQIMQRGFRTGDLLFRFGGEEFVVITQHTDLEGAKTVFSRLLQSVASFPFPQIGQVTVSIGIVQLQPGNLTPILLDQADKALYYAKQNGRNQLAVYEELRDRGLLSESRLTMGTVDLF